MKQFYETYSVDSGCYQLWLNVQTTGQNPIVSPTAAQLKTSKNRVNEFLSSPPTQLQDTDSQHIVFVSTLLTQIQWSSHLHILSKTKTPEEKVFYLLLAKNDKLSVRELERQLNSAVFERTLLSRQKVSSMMTLFASESLQRPLYF